MREKVLVVTVLIMHGCNHLCRYVHVGGVECFFCCMSIYFSMCAAKGCACVCVIADSGALL